MLVAYVLPQCYQGLRLALSLTEDENSATPFTMLNVQMKKKKKLEPVM